MQLPKLSAALFGFIGLFGACDSGGEDNDERATSEEPASSGNGSPRMQCLDSAEVGKAMGTPAAPLMNAWGAACEVDADCEALLGAGAVCDPMSVIYELPGNYCTKPCQLPDTSTTVVLDDPACDPAGGVHCVGQAPLYQRCVPACTEDAQCNRHGYLCRTMPSISQPQDPSFCLMPDCCQGSCGE